MTLNQTDIPSHDLLALKPTLFFPRSLTFNHSFASTNPIRPSIDHKMATAMPVFNYDGQHFTPAFVLGVDQVLLILLRTTTSSTRSLNFKNIWKRSDRQTLKSQTQ